MKSCKQELWGDARGRWMWAEWCVGDLVFFYNKSLLFYSCFTKAYLVLSLYYLICKNYVQWIGENLHGSVSGVVGFFEWLQGLSAFRDGLGGRSVCVRANICRCLSLFVDGLVLFCYFILIRGGNFLLDTFSFLICTCLGFARSLLGCFRVLLDRFCRLFNWPFKG